MKEYEIVIKFLNTCAGAAYPQITFDEAVLDNTDDYIRSRHGMAFSQFSKELLPNGQIHYRYENGVTYIYEFTEL